MGWQISLIPYEPFNKALSIKLCLLQGMRFYSECV